MVVGICEPMEGEQLYLALWTFIYERSMKKVRRAPFAKGPEISHLSNNNAIGCGTSINQGSSDGQHSKGEKISTEMSAKYPTTMSCREAFDQLTSCYSIGGQFRNYYRHGDFTSCDKQVSKFKFCIVHGSDPVKVQEWHKEQVSNNKTLQNSTGIIWQEKETAVKKK